jgi:hypothetical protein
VQVAGDEEQLADQATKRAGVLVYSSSNSPAMGAFRRAAVQYLHAGRCWVVPSGALILLRPTMPVDGAASPCAADDLLAEAGAVSGLVVKVARVA